MPWASENGYVAIPGCRSLSQYPGHTFCKVAVAENRDFTLEFRSCLRYKYTHRYKYLYISGFGNYIAVFGYLSLSQSSGDINFLPVADNPKFAVRISMLYVIAPEILAFPVQRPHYFRVYINVAFIWRLSLSLSCRNFAFTTRIAVTYLVAILPY